MTGIRTLLLSFLCSALLALFKSIALPLLFYHIRFSTCLIPGLLFHHGLAASLLLFGLLLLLNKARCSWGRLFRQSDLDDQSLQEVRSCLRALLLRGR